MTKRLMVYGATGYTGKLVAKHAHECGLTAVLAGRNAERVESVAKPLGFESTAFELTDVAEVKRKLEGVTCLLNIAGPFAATARPMLEACLAAGVHYLDVTGEIDVFELAASLGPRAEKAGVMLLPGVGFDVVPSDCLAAHAAGQVEKPVRLRLAISGLGTASRGTMKTAIEALGAGTRVRRNGEIVSLPAGSLQRTFDFGAGPKPCIALSWGDIATAYHSTGIPDIEVYFLAAGEIAWMTRASRLFGWLLTSGPVQGLLKGLIDRQPEGPSPEQLETAGSIVLAEAEGADGRVARSRLETPNGYKITYLAAVEIARRVLEGETKLGYQTPSRAYGADFVLELPGCRRIDL